jgi:hypothetical protein
MSKLTVIEAEVAHLEGGIRDAYQAAENAFKAELVRLGIIHTVTPAAPEVKTDPAPVAVKGQPEPASTEPTNH